MEPAADSPLWQPSEAVRRQANLTRYMEWLAERRGLRFDGPLDLWQWSVTRLEDFWATIWDYFEVQASAPYKCVLEERRMPGAKWFPGARLNYAEHIFRRASPGKPALLYASEDRPLAALDWDELRRQTARAAAGLRRLGVRPGDRVAAYLPNIPETIVAFLACASLGAVWSACGPDFGTNSVIDRFKQIEPKVLFAVDGYRYNGKALDRLEVVARLQAGLPGLQHTILVPHLDPGRDPRPDLAALAGPEPPVGSANTWLWSELLAAQAGQDAAAEAELTFEQLEFDHPLWILYSSGTTGLPKAVVQGHGGILLEHLKSVCFHSDLKPGEVLNWYTTTSWMMWNKNVSSLLAGATLFIYSGSPGYPDLNTLWRYAEQTGATTFGTSPAFIANCMKAGLEPGRDFDLSRLRIVGITGSPLPPEGFHWIYEHVKPDVWLSSASGGTDICTGLVGGCILLPVYVGELMGLPLGVKTEAFDEQGRPVVDQVGELVVTEPMPSMPLYFWNDPQGQRYRASYFDMFPGVWRHGDWIKINRRGGAVIYGRSDSTINRQGVRMGSSEIYRVVEARPEVLDSLVIGVELPGGGYYMPLFVKLREGHKLDDRLKTLIKQQLRAGVSPNHVPDEIIQVPDIPYTLTGKKLEVPVKRLLQGVPIEKAASLDALQNPDALRFFADFASKRT